MTTTPQVGDFALTRISGFTGRAIAFGQALIGDGAPVQHAYLYVGGGYIVQAMPNGAEMIRLEDANDPVVWSSGLVPLTAAQRMRIASESRELVGTPYSFVDYASIGLAYFHIRPSVVRRYIASTGHMICSQLVDEVYKRAGVQLFYDGRLPGDVTPGDLWHALQLPREARAEAVRVDVREAA